MSEKFVIMRHWLDKAEKVCSEEQFNELSGALIKYGLYKIEVECKDSTVEALFLFIKDQIDRMQGVYEQKVDLNKRLAGRKSAFNAEENEKIYELACKGYKVKEIAAKMGIFDDKKIKAMYNSIGWKSRKK